MRYADMRYVGQEHSVKAEFPVGPVTDEAIAQAAEAFRAAHEREYGFRLDSPVELVNFHVAGLLPVAKPALPSVDGDRRRRGHARCAGTGASTSPSTASTSRPSISARSCRRTPG